jgi:hypothetical protein
MHHQQASVAQLARHKRCASASPHQIRVMLVQVRMDGHDALEGILFRRVAAADAIALPEQARCSGEVGVDGSEVRPEVVGGERVGVDLLV